MINVEENEKVKKVRLNIYLTEKDSKLLDNLVTRTDSVSRSEVIRRLIRLHFRIENRREDGFGLYLINKEDEKIIELLHFS